MVAPAAKRRRKSGLDYGTLETRQVLTTFIDLGFIPTFQRSAEFSIPLNDSVVVLTELEEAPDVVAQPENGDLEYRSSDGILVYKPDAGFTGLDEFEIQFGVDGDDNKVDFNVNVWETAYATPDWQKVDPGQATTIDVLANDYAFIEVENSYFTGRFGQHGNLYSWIQDSAGFTIVEASATQFGTLTISEDGRSLVFESTEGFEGEQEVTYTIEDSRGFQTTGTLTIYASDQSLSDRYYVNESQWEQEQIEKWLAQYAGNINHRSNVPKQPSDFDNEIWVVDGRIDFPADIGFFGGFDATGNFLSATENGVQEGDIVKSHGDTVYYVTHEKSFEGDFRSYLSIVDVSDSNSPTLISTTGFENRIKDIFLDQDRIAVVTAAFADWGIDLHWGHRANEFELTVLDVSSPVVPTEVYSATVDGSYTDARLIGDRLYLVSQGGTLRARSLWDMRKDVTNPVSPGDYVNALLNDENAFGMPSVTVNVGGEVTTTHVEVDQYLRRGSGNNGTLVTTFDIRNATNKPVDLDFFESDRISTVYVSSESMYLFGSGSIIKLAFDVDAEVNFAADGVLEGDLLNQFSASEHDGMLRVAVNDWQDRSSDIYVFEQSGDSLNVVGSLEDFAPGEQIYSTTFVEDQLFVVTFRQVDPLFVIDMEDATSPTILGELKIPGVSHYLQLIDDDILLAVGRDAEVSTGWQTSLQVSLFDVSDQENPLLLDRYTFDGGLFTDTPLFRFWGGADGHQALTFDQESGTLALPVNRTADNYSSSIALFELSRENGIESIGEVGFDTAALRTLISEDRVIYFSEDSIKTADLESPTVVLADLELPPEDSMARGVGAANKVCLRVDSNEPDDGLEMVLEVSRSEIGKAEIDQVFSFLPDFAALDQLRFGAEDEAILRRR